MNNLESIHRKNLLDEFIKSSQLQHNGKLEIKSDRGNVWSFYYRLGRIVWATGGTHPWRRWRRHMVQHCPNLNCDDARFRLEDTLVEYWDYNLLIVLYQRQKLKLEQIKIIVENTISELLFDVVQQINIADINSDTCNAILRTQRNQEVILEAPLSFTSADLSLKQVEETWKMWLDAGLANILPDTAPLLCEPDRLQQLVSSSVYKNFVTLLNGKYTLKDLAIKMNHNPFSVARSLFPYIQQGIIELVEVTDLPLITQLQNNSTTNKCVESTAPLVACIDDSPQVCQRLEEIITSNGLRFLKIQDPLQALPTIIQQKPDLIFLDIMMPVVNGYELCSQLRRIPNFVNTPVIIITGSDGFIDRVRAKVVNATHFLAKPIVSEKVMNAVYKYLKVTKLPIKSQSNIQRLPLTGS